MRGNFVMLMGRACRTPELKNARNSKVCTIRLAVNERIKKRDGEWEDKTMYIDCEAWGQRAEYVAGKVEQGDLVQVVGKLEQDEWDAKDGSGKRQKHKVYISYDVQVDKRRGGDGQSQQQDETANAGAGGGSNLPF